MTDTTLWLHVCVFSGSIAKQPTKQLITKAAHIYNKELAIKQPKYELHAFRRETLLQFLHVHDPFDPINTRLCPIIF